MKSDLQWMQAQVVALRDLTPTVREFELRPEAGTAGGHEPGAHLQVQVTSAQGQLQTRSYSLCLLYTSPSPRDVEESRMPSSA